MNQLPLSRNTSMMKLNRFFLIMAAFLGGITILLGAFGAHGLKEKLDPAAMENYQTGVEYMMYHVLAILLLYNLAGINEKDKNRIAAFFLFGILFFSGSIFMISLDLVEAKSIWFITPLGGVLFVIGWLYMTYMLVRK